MLNRLFKAKRGSREEEFWKWFEANSAQYFEFERNQEPLFDRLQRALWKVERGLTFEFGPIEDGARDFVISADGIKDRFPAVERLIQVAPELREWRIIGFRPRRSTEMEIEVGKLKLSSDRVWFALEDDNKKVGLHFYLAGVKDGESEDALMATFLFLDNALGEYDMETKVGFIEPLMAPENPAEHGLKPYRELPAEFDAFYSNLTDY